MISELKKSEFFKCRYMLYEQGQLEAKAVVEGINPGRIFVDDIESPASGLIWLSNNDGFFFIGLTDLKRLCTVPIPRVCIKMFLSRVYVIEVRSLLKHFLQ